MALRRRAFCEQDEAELRGRGALVVRVVVRKKAHGYVVLFVSIKEKNKVQGIPCKKDPDFS